MRSKEPLVRRLTSLAVSVAVSWLLLAAVSPLQPASAQTCKLPPPERPFLLPLESEEDAVMEARCFVACAGNLLNESFISGSATVWPTISLLQLGGCDGVKQVMECRRGCVTALKSPHLFLNECRHDCEESCSSVCTGQSNCDPNYDGTSCTRECQPASYCDTGCQFAQDINITSTSSEAHVPALPVDGLSLRKTSLKNTRRLDAGVFDLFYDVPPAGNETRDIVAFVIRVEFGNSTRFIVQASLSDPLDLGYFACEQVNVSFAVINNNSLSDGLNFSPKVEVFVHGESDPPSQITGVNYDQVLEIFTEDFYGSGRGLFKMSWSRPNGFEQLSHYVVELYSTIPGCHDPSDEIDIQGQRFANKTFILDKSETGLVVRAQTPMDLPVFKAPSDCDYQIIVRSQPQRGPIFSQPLFFDIFSMRSIMGAPPIEQSIKCTREVDEIYGKISVTLSWMGNFSHLPPTYYNDTLDYTVLSLYRAREDSSYDDLDYRRELHNLLIHSTGLEVEGVSSGDFLRQFRGNGTIIGTVYEVRANGSGFVSVYGLPPAGEKTEYGHVLLLWQNHVKRHLTYRLSQFLHTNFCVLDLRPLPPNTIDKDTINIPVFEISNTTNINLTISWMHPSTTYGLITAYEVIVTKDPLFGQVDVMSSASVIYTSSGTLTASDQLMQLEIAERLNVPFGEGEDPCLFVQANIQNEYLQRSNWSEPIAVARNSSYLEQCGFNVTDGNVTAETEPPEPTADHSLYISIGSVLGSLFVLAAVIILLICIPVCVNYRRKRKLFKSLSSAPIISTSKGHGKVWWGTASQKYQPVDGWEIPSTSIILEEQLGEGCFGEVHRGVVKGPLPTTHMMKSAICKTVAVKFLKRFASGPERKDFINEIGLMKTIAEGNCPHVVSLIGCVTEKEPLCLITEYLPYGDLLSYLHSIRKMLKQAYVDTGRFHSADSGYPASQEFNPEDYILPVSSGTGEAGSSGIENGQSSYKAYDHLDPPPAKYSAYDHLVPPEKSPYAALGGVGEADLTSFAYQIASGMEYVASLDIVHRDLACRNVLVGEGKVLKIADFGMSRVVDSEDPVYVKTSKGRLPWKWMAIESIVYRKFTSASDVWSYGVALWEIATLGGFPYPSVANDDLLTYLRNGGRLDKPEGCNQIVFDTMMDCWSEEPDKRPTFANLKCRFDKMLLQNNHYILFSNYANMTGNPPGYDHLNNPAVVVNHQQNGPNSQSHPHRTKPTAVRPMSAPLLDTDPSTLGPDNISTILRSATNSYVQPPTSVAKFKARNTGDSSKWVIEEKQGRVNEEKKKNVQVRVSGVNHEAITTPEILVNGYDRLELPVDTEKILGSYVGYDHLQAV